MPVTSFSNVPEGMMRVPPALTCWPVVKASPAGLKKMAEPSLQGEATAVPARPMAQLPCSYTPYPWARTARGTVIMQAHTPTASQTENRRIVTPMGHEGVQAMQQDSDTTGWLRRCQKRAIPVHEGMIWIGNRLPMETLTEPSHPA